MQIEKIHDIRRTLSYWNMTYELYPTPRVGVVNLKVARVIAFIVIVLSVLASATVCVLTIWEVIPQIYAWRSLESLGIVSAAVAILIALNEGFGPAVRGYPLGRVHQVQDVSTPAPGATPATNP